MARLAGMKDGHVEAVGGSDQILFVVDDMDVDDRSVPVVAGGCNLAQVEAGQAENGFVGSLVPVGKEDAFLHETSGGNLGGCHMASVLAGGVVGHSVALPTADWAEASVAFLVKWEA